MQQTNQQAAKQTAADVFSAGTMCPLCRTLQECHEPSGLCRRCLKVARAKSAAWQEPARRIVMPGVYRSTGARSNGVETFVRIR